MAQPQRHGVASPRKKDRPLGLVRSIHERKLLGMVRRQLPTDASLAGDTTIPLTPDTLRKIGRTALDVYDALLQSRDLNGQTHASLPGIARKASAPIEETNGYPRSKLTEKSVRNALHKLVKLKLVENLGWTYRVVPCAAATCRAAGLPPAHEHKVYLRRVMGLITVKSDTKDPIQLLLPRDAATELKKATTHGGTRPGGGRPKGSKDSKPRRGWRDPTLDMPVEQFDRGPTPVAPLAGRVRKAADENQDGRTRESTQVLALDLRSSSKSAAPKAPGAEVASLSKSKTPPPAPPPAPIGGSHFPDRAPSVGGLRIGGASEGARGLAVYAPRTSDEWMPPFPGPDVFASPRVPPPPPLDPKLDRVDQVAVLARAYRTAVTEKFRIPCMTLANATRLEGRREYKPLAAAADLMVKHSVIPIDWILWSFGVWKHYGLNAESKRPDGPPPITWVFSPARIEKWHGWFHAEHGTSRGGAVIPIPALRELYACFEKVRFALIRGESQSEAVTRYLPREKYEALLATARAEAAEAILNINRRLQAGHFIW